MKRVNSEEKEDRLSSLPDEIIIEIISKLPIKSCVSTSVLSRRWPHLWTHITDLLFELPLIEPTIITHILSQIKSPQINNFKVVNLNLVDDVDKDNSSLFFHTASWIRLLCDRKVEHVFLGFFHVLRSKDTLTLPTCLFRCQSLASLNFDVGIDFTASLPGDDDHDIFLPNLTLLRITFLNPCYHALSSTKLFKSCPKLQRLQTSAAFVDKMPDSFDNESPLVVSSQKLQWLCLDFSFHGCRQRCIPVYVDAPNLQFLSASHTSIKFSKIPSALEDAELRGGKWMITGEMQSFQLFLAILGVSTLMLDFGVFDGLRNNITGDLEIPKKFSNLTSLVCSLTDSVAWKDILFMLCNAPNLEYLMFDMYDYVHVEDPIECPKIPSCLNNIKRLGIRFDNADNGVLDVLNFFLRNATSLELLIVVKVPSTENECQQLEHLRRLELLDKLLEVPRSSQSCDIQVRRPKSGCGQF